MSVKKLLVLGLVAVFVLLLAVMQSKVSNNGRPEAGGPAYLIQGLEPAKVGIITVKGGSNSTTLKREGDHFIVVEKSGYPAVNRNVNEIITTCLDLKIGGDVYTEDKANHKDLGVTEDGAREIVRFLSPESELITGVVIGKSREQGPGVYVRLVSEDKVYVIQNDPYIRTRAIEYVDQNPVTLKNEDIESVTVSSPAGNYTLKTDGRNIEMVNMPSGKRFKGTEYQQVFNALTGFYFDDVGKAADYNDLSFDRQFICRMKDSAVYTVKAANKGEKWYMTFDAEFTDKTPVTKQDGVESQDELEKKEAKLLARDNMKEFSAKHSGWVYEIAEYNGKLMTKDISELLEDDIKSDANAPADPNKAKK